MENKKYEISKKLKDLGFPQLKDEAYGRYSDGKATMEGFNKEIMKIFIPQHTNQKIGGGWTFVNTFVKYSKDSIVDNADEAEVILISGATMVDREFMNSMKDAGKKIVLRVDNIPKNSRNRNTGTSRLKEFAQMADLVVYQSHWAKKFLMPFLGKDGPVIINGADQEIFNTEGSKQPKEGAKQYVFVQYNRDETKEWHRAWYEFQMISRANAGAHLWIIGRFSPEQEKYNFDFFMGEKYRYIGVVGPEDMAEYLRAADVLLLPYFNDACSNTLVEARACGVKEVWQNCTGGNLQIMNSPVNMLTAKRMVYEYMIEFNKLINK